jgi:hypothetical protein
MTGAASDNPERRLLVWNARHSGILIEFEHILICRSTMHRRTLMRRDETGVCPPERRIVPN